MYLTEKRIGNVISGIDKPINQRNTGKGNPNAILHSGRPLNTRQRGILEALPNYDSKVIMHKKTVNMRDLSALTAHTGDEFALFTIGSRRLIIRGNSFKVNVDEEYARTLNSMGYKWTGHTHPGFEQNDLLPSSGDLFILSYFSQRMSNIYNAKGKKMEFRKELT